MTLKKAESILLFLCLLLLPTQLGKHFFLDFSYIYSLQIDYLAPTIYFWDLLLLVLILVWVLQKPKINKLAFNLFLFFLLTQAISLIGALNLGAGIFKLEQLILTGLLGVYIAGQNFNYLKKQIVSAFSITLLFEGGLAFWQVVFKKTLGFWILGERSFNISTPSIAKFDFFGQIFLRPYGTFPHPNLLAAFLLIGVILIYCLRDKNQKILTLSIWLGSLAIFLTFSRAVILVFVIWLFLIFRKKIKLLWPVFLIIPFLAVRFLTVLNYDNLSIIRREELAILAVGDFLSAPLKGLGLNSFINQTAISHLVSGESRFLQPVHNIFLLTLAETGILGLSGILGLLGIPIVNLWKKKNLIESKILLGVWIIIFFLGMLDHYFLTLAQGLRLFFLIWGLSLSRMKDSD